MVITRVLRKDPRNYTKDFGIWLEIFEPQSQQTFTFLISDEELRLYMSVALEVDIEAKGVNSLSVHELLDKRNIKLMLAQRLIVHKASKKSALPLITFSKHALGQRGELRLTRGWAIPTSRYAPSENSNLMKTIPGKPDYFNYMVSAVVVCAVLMSIGSLLTSLKCALLASKMHLQC